MLKLLLFFLTSVSIMSVDINVYRNPIGILYENELKVADRIRYHPRGSPFVCLRRNIYYYQFLDYFLTRGFISLEGSKIVTMGVVPPVCVRIKWSLTTN